MNRLAPSMTALLVLVSLTLITCLPVAAQDPVDFSYGELPPGWIVGPLTDEEPGVSGIVFSKGDPPTEEGSGGEIRVNLSPPPEYTSCEMVGELIGFAKLSVWASPGAGWSSKGVSIDDIVQEDLQERQVEIGGETAVEFTLRNKWCDEHGTCAAIIDKAYCWERFQVGVAATMTPEFEAEVDAIINTFRFGGEAPAATLTPEGSDCQASIHYDPNIQPGEVLSPWASYISLKDGQEVVPIGEAFFIDGSQTPSVTWDGTETSIELQYTCPGHQGHSETITVPAFGVPTATETSTPEQTATPTPTPTETEVPEPVLPPEESQADVVTPTHTPTCTPTPTKCPELSPDAKLNQILDLYYSSIPKGITDSGKKNNILSLWDDKYSEFVCGGYQSKVLAFLDRLKFSSDVCQRELLDDWDYGPIEAYYGGHQAVVLYRGTDWTETGIVLDPWITQTPQIYAIQEWSVRFSQGTYYGIRGSSQYEKNADDPSSQAQYPTVGGNYVQPGRRKLSSEENAFIQTLPPDKQKQLKRMTVDNRAAWIKQAMGRQGQPVRTIVNCPLDVYVTNGAGQTSGFRDEQLTAELEDVSIGRIQLADGGYWTELSYPHDRGYTLAMQGTGDGLARVLTRVEDIDQANQSPVYEYAFPVEAGRSYQLDADAPGSPLRSEGMQVEAMTVSEPDLAWLDAQPGVAETGASPETEVIPAPAGLALPLPWVLALSCGGLLVVGLLGGLVAVMLRPRRRRTPVPASSPGPVPASSPGPVPAPSPGPGPLSSSSYSAAAGADATYVEGADGTFVVRPDWRLRVLAGVHVGQVFFLGQQTQLGRHQDSQILLNDEQASRRHALIQRQGDNVYLISDLGSSNGTFVNGQRISQPTPLNAGDTIRIGGTEFEVMGGG